MLENKDASPATAHSPCRCPLLNKVTTEILGQKKRKKERKYARRAKAKQNCLICRKEPVCREQASEIHFIRIEEQKFKVRTPPWVETAVSIWMAVRFEWRDAE